MSCSFLIASMYAIVSIHVDIPVFSYDFYSGNLVLSHFYYHVHYVFIPKTMLLHSVQVQAGLYNLLL